MPAAICPGIPRRTVDARRASRRVAVSAPGHVNRPVVEKAQERGDDIRIELPFGASQDLGARRRAASLAGRLDPGLGDRDDPGLDRDAPAPDPQRVARAVVALMVLTDDRRQLASLGKGSQQLHAHPHVIAHSAKLRRA